MDARQAGGAGVDCQPAGIPAGKNGKRGMHTDVPAQKQGALGQGAPAIDSGLHPRPRPVERSHNRIGRRGCAKQRRRGAQTRPSQLVQAAKYQKRPLTEGAKGFMGGKDDGISPLQSRIGQAAGAQMGSMRRIDDKLGATVMRGIRQCRDRQTVPVIGRTGQDGGPSAALAQGAAQGVGTDVAGNALFRKKGGEYIGRPQVEQGAAVQNAFVTVAIQYDGAAGRGTEKAQGGLEPLCCAAGKKKAAVHAIPAGDQGLGFGNGTVAFV